MPYLGFADHICRKKSANKNAVWLCTHANFHDQTTEHADGIHTLQITITLIMGKNPSTPIGDLCQKENGANS